MEPSAQVAAYKKSRALSIRDAARERELIERNSRNLADPDIGPYYGSSCAASSTCPAPIRAACWRA